MNLLLISILLITTVYFYMKRRYNHWRRNNIVQLDPKFPFGDAKEIILQKKSFSDLYCEIYQKYKELKVPFGGTYFAYRPELLILDPDIIKSILVKDFNHFIDRRLFNKFDHEPLSRHLFNLEGEEWRKWRVKLTPTFTSGKMKMMFGTLVACSNELNNILLESTKKKEPLDIKDILARYTTDVIGSCAFGIDCNCLKDQNNDFRKFGLQVFEPTGFFNKFTRIAALLFPRFLRLFKVPVINEEVSEFFLNTVKSTVQYREENNVYRKDFMQLLIQLKNHGEVKDNIEHKFVNGITKDNQGITIEQIAAQCFVFFLAGFETSSTTMTFCLYELSKNQEIQDKLRLEINNVLEKHGGNLTYDAIMEMHYMEKVINETLRKYPPLSFLTRVCTQDYKLPKSNYTIRKGERIKISVLGIHRDPEYYPDPEKFDPERFNEENTRNRPFVYYPFGEGPRICIGLRFGMLESKIGLATLLKNYRFTLNEKTPDPIVMDPNNLILSTKGGIWLDAQKVEY